MTRFTAFTSASDDSDDDGSYASKTQPDHDRSMRMATELPTSNPHVKGTTVVARLTEDEGEAEEESTQDSQSESESDFESESESESEGDEHERPLALTRPRATDGHLSDMEDSDSQGRSSRDEERSDSSTSSEADIEEPHHREPGVISWAQRVGVDIQKMHVMQTSLFRMPEEAAALQAINKPAHPRFRLAPAVARKRSRDSLGDGRAESQERASFAYDIDAPVHRPSRKYTRVKTPPPVAKKEARVDAGSAFGRFFPIGWAPGGKLVHLGRLGGPSSQSRNPADSSVITITTVPFFSEPLDEVSNRLSRLLEHHLSKTPILKDEEGVPFADPPHDLCFSSFTPVYPQIDVSYEASLFRLGHALFDSLDVRLAPEITIDVRNRTDSLRRKAALSAWLEEAVAPSVNADLNKPVSGDPIGLIYTLLTGHQIEKACETAMDCSFIKLATLISQAPGDFDFREDIKDQLQIWYEQRVDVHIGESTRKLYSILAGNTDILEGSKTSSLERCPDVDPLKGLDWKRTFAMYLWFAEPMDAPISQVFESYHQASQNFPSRIAPPLPRNLEGSQDVKPLYNIPEPPPPDALFSLIRLYAEPACSLSQVLSPLSFGSHPSDYSLAWHLYIVLSRCMRVRDFSDRGPGEFLSSDEDDQERREGHSPSADLLASHYAHQLEQLGLLQEAVFVLLHIEGSAGREKAVRDLLQRSADKLDEWMCSGILGSLKVPLAWVNEAKALYAIHTGNVFEAYQLYMAAGLYQAGHDLAVTELAPEAVIKQDFELLDSLFERMSSQTVDGWHLKGKAFMDYAHAMTRLPKLYASASDGAIDAAGEQELESFSRSIPKLISVISDLFPSSSDPRHMVALSEMTSGLVAGLDQINPLALAQSQLRLLCVDEGTKLHHIRAMVFERFMRSIQAA